MSLQRVNPDAGDAAADANADLTGAGAEPASRAGRRWPVRPSPWPSPPVTAMLLYAGIRALSVATAAYLLGHGQYRRHGWSLLRWMGSWDGGHYQIIAAHGYTYRLGQLAHASVFSWFPGYPAVIDSVAWLPGVTIVTAGLVVTAVAGLMAAWGLTALGLKLTGDPRISLLMVAIWAVAPSSIVLNMMYSEALFCALACWALVALVSRRWLTAGVLTLLAGTVRSTAVALVLAVLVAALIAVMQAVRTRQPFAAWWRPAAAVLLAPLGLLGYLGYVALATHRLDGWFWIEKHASRMDFDWGVSTLRAMNGALAGTPSVGPLLVTAALAAAVLLTLWSLTERIPVYLHVYTLAVVFLAVTTSAYWLGSKPRFLLPAVLLALPLARLLAPLRMWVLVPLVGVLVVASTWFGLYIAVIAGWAL